MSSEITGTRDEGRRSPRLLTVPGLCCSGPDHWQSLWERNRANCRRIEMPDWDDPEPGAWIRAVDRAITLSSEPVVFAAHSLGCHAVALWSAHARADGLSKVRGALLVAPPDVQRLGSDARVQRFADTATRLPFPSLLVASTDDPWAAFERSGDMAREWGADLIDAGALGHINAESGIGAWGEGEALLEQMLQDDGCGDRI